MNAISPWFSLPPDSGGAQLNNTAQASGFFNLGSLLDISARLPLTYWQAAAREIFGTTVPLIELQPSFHIDEHMRAGRIPPVDVTSQIIAPNCRLWNLTLLNAANDAHAFLYVSANSGSPVGHAIEAALSFLHYGNVRLLQWIDPHYVPADYPMGLDSYITPIVTAAQLNPGCHLIGNSQSTITATAAAAWMYQNRELSLSAPASLTVIGGPLDTSKDPDFINWMATHSVAEPLTIPVGWLYSGYGRPIVPGEVMKLIFKHAPGEPHSPYPAQALAAEFLHDMLELVFRKHAFARGAFPYRGRRIETAAIKCPLMGFTGFKDRICTPAQTCAVRDFTPNAEHSFHQIPGAGHYALISRQVMTDFIVPTIASQLGLISHCDLR